MAGLTIAPATGSQDTTQNPQTVPKQTVGASTQSGGVQPGTAATLLTSEQGVSLQPSALTTVSLAAGTRTHTQASSQPAAQPAQHHVNPAWLGGPVILCLAAAGLFWAMTRSAKSTTN